MSHKLLIVFLVSKYSSRESEPMCQFTPKGGRGRGVPKDAMHIDEGAFEGCSCKLRRNGGFNAAMNIGLDAGIRSFKI